MQTLIIMQGVPGSGKSTMAKAIRSGWEGPEPIYLFSTDQFFYVEGEYKFDPSKLSEYHNLNQERTLYHLEQGDSVIVDNTNILRRHAKPYVVMAHVRNIPVVFVTCQGRFKNIHGVPPETIARMFLQMERLTVEGCLNEIK